MHLLQASGAFTVGIYLSATDPLQLLLSAWLYFSTFFINFAETCTYTVCYVQTYIHTYIHQGVYRYQYCCLKTFGEYFQLILRLFFLI